MPEKSSGTQAGRGADSYAASPRHGPAATAGTGSRRQLRSIDRRQFHLVAPSVREVATRVGRGCQPVLLAALLVVLVGCRSAPVTPDPPDRVTATTEPTSTQPEPTQTPEPPAASATARPTATPTGSTEYEPYERALRPAFRSDRARLPDATHYKLDLNVCIEKAILFGRQRMGYTNTETVPLHDLYLRLFPNTPGYGGRMSVTSLALDGKRIEAEIELDGSALRVPLSPALPPGRHVDLTLDFSLALPSDGHPADSRQPSDGYRQLGIYDGIIALANAYPIIPVYDDEGWNVELAPSYGDAVFSDAAFFDVSMTAPSGLTLAASGDCIVAEAGPAGTTWSCMAAPMRDFNAVLGGDYEVTSRDVGGITVNSLSYARHYTGGIAALDYASRAVRLFDARIGPYPYTELDVVESPTLAGGIEYPGLIVINQSYYDGEEGVSARMEWVVVHEVLHQWWYSLVGNDQVDEPWLDEALVQYCTLLYFEQEYGQSVAQRLLTSVFQQPYQELQEAGRDQPAGLPVAEYTRRDYGPVVYQKGPLYFHHLRQQVGSDTFWKILQTYFERHRYGVARPEDWLEAVRAVTGDEHRPLYDKWIRGAGS